MKIIDIKELKDGGCNIEVELTVKEVSLLLSHVLEEAFTSYAQKQGKDDDEKKNCCKDC